VHICLQLQPDSCFIKETFDLTQYVGILWSPPVLQGGRC